MQEELLEKQETECCGSCGHEDLAKDEDVENVDGEVSRWSYFVVKSVAHEFKSKVEVKRWLMENGVEDSKVIRGRILPVGEKIVRRIAL